MKSTTFNVDEITQLTAAQYKRKYGDAFRVYDVPIDTLSQLPGVTGPKDSKVSSIAKDYEISQDRPPRIGECEADGEKYIITGYNMIELFRKNNRKTVKCRVEPYDTIDEIHAQWVKAQKIDNRSGKNQVEIHYGELEAGDEHAIMVHEMLKSHGISIRMGNHDKNISAITSVKKWAHRNKFGLVKVEEAIRIILGAWNGLSESLSAKHILLILRFLDCPTVELGRQFDRVTIKKVIKAFSSEDVEGIWYHINLAKIQQDLNPSAFGLQYLKQLYNEGKKAEDHI